MSIERAGDRDPGAVDPVPVREVGLNHPIKIPGGIMSEYRKAIFGGLSALLAALATALADGAVTSLEWVIVAGAAVTGATAVWAVPNTPTVNVRNDAAR